MASDLNSSIVLNPMMVWADLGLRALDMTVASTQNIGDGVDRLARASASEPVPVATVSSGSAPDASPSPAAATLALTAQLQRSTFDLLTQGWLQWMSTLGTFASMAASPSAAQGLMGQTVALRSTTSAARRSATESSAGQVAQGSTSNGKARRRAADDEREALEHAVASQPRRRRTSARTKSKPRSRGE